MERSTKRLGLTASPSRSGREFTRSRRGDWLVWVDSAAWREEWWAIVEQSLASPAEVLRKSRYARTFTLPLGQEDGRHPAFLKVYHRAGWRSDLKDLWRPSRALRALRISQRLADDGFLVPPVLAAGELRVGRLLQRAFLLTEGVPWPTLAQLGEELSGLPADESRRRRSAVVEALGLEVGRFHLAGYVHGDLVVTNMLVDDGDRPRFCFLDHDRSRKRAKPSEREQLRCLVQLNRLPVPGVRSADRFRFLVRYARARDWSRADMRRYARWIARKTKALRLAREKSIANAASNG